MNPFTTHKQLLSKYLHSETIPYLEHAWNEPHRFYHNINHLIDIISEIDKSHFKLDPITYDTLILAAFFHDCYYNPRENKIHENESIKRFLVSYNYKDINIKNSVIAIIESTKYRKRPLPFLLKLFWEADNSGFLKGYEYLLKTENLIRKEFNFVSRSTYKEKRIEFLKSNFGLFNKNADEDLKKLIIYVENSYK